MKTYKQMLERLKWYPGRYIDFDGAYQAQCMDLTVDFMWWATDGKYRMWGNAIDAINDRVNNYGKFATIHKNTENFLPEVGDIAVWTKPPAHEVYGHIGIVYGNINLNTCTMLDQNWDGDPSRPAKLRTDDYRGVTHFIRINFEGKKEQAPSAPDNKNVMIIDVSQFQSPNAINYKTLSSQVDAVIIRTMDADYEDTAYDTHHKKFKEHGVPTMAYAFVRGTTIQQMKNEAKMFYDRTKEHDPTFWWLDVETISMPKASEMRGAVSAYMKELRRLGAKKVGLYIAHHLYEQLNLDTSEADAVWIPHYGNGSATANSKPDFYADIHQYTERGSLPGYSGNLDLNRMLGDKPLEFFTDGKSSKKKPAAPPQSTKPVAAPKAKTYKVKPGDTLSGIAVYTGVSQVRLQSLNGITNPDVLNADTVLKLTGAVTPQKVSGSKYRIKPGDTLSRIAAANNTTVEALRKLNASIKNSDVIYADNDLVLPGNASKAVYHKVVYGDTVDALAIRYGSTRDKIVSWNKLSNANDINAGQKLRVK